MTTWILGEPLGCQDDVAVAEAWYATSQCLPRITPFVKQFPWIVTLALKLPVSLIQAVMPNLASLVSLRKSMYTAHQKHTTRKTSSAAGSSEEKMDGMFPTVFDVLDNSSLPASEKDVDRQAQEAFVLVAGGTETTARTITACMFQLVSNPSIYARLRAELKEVMPEPQSEPSLKTLENLPYFVRALPSPITSAEMLMIFVSDCCFERKPQEYAPHDLAISTPSTQ